VGLLNPLVFMHFVSGSHNDALMVGLLLAGLAMGLNNRPYLGIVLIAMAGTIKIPALVGLGFIGLIWAGKDSALVARIRCWSIAVVITIGVFLFTNAIAGLGFGWIHALGTPGVVRSWISPVTSVSVASGWLISAAGFGDYTEVILAVLRGIATLAVLAYAAKLLLKPSKQNAIRSAGLVLLLLAVFGPVIQPWYLLWGLLIMAAAGFTRKELPYVVAATAGLVIHGLTQSSATSADVLQVADPVSAVLAIGAAVLGIMSSRTTRTELLEGKDRWANAPHATSIPEQGDHSSAESTVAGKIAPRERP
jgi:hypothetical protein